MAFKSFVSVAILGLLIIQSTSTTTSKNEPAILPVEVVRKFGNFFGGGGGGCRCDGCSCSFRPSRKEVKEICKRHPDCHVKKYPTSQGKSSMFACCPNAATPNIGKSLGGGGGRARGRASGGGGGDCHCDGGCSCTFRRSRKKVSEVCKLYPDCQVKEYPRRKGKSRTFGCCPKA